MTKGDMMQLWKNHPEFKPSTCGYPGHYYMHKYHGVCITGKLSEDGYTLGVCLLDEYDYRMVFKSLMMDEYND